MKKNIDNNFTGWLTDRELMKSLKVDDLKISEIILRFDLLAYDFDGEIRHFYDENHSELVFEIGSLKFKKEEVDEFIKNNPGLGDSERGRPASYRWRLENRLKNILHLDQIRDQQLLPPSSYLKKEKRRMKEEIKNSNWATSGQQQKGRSRSKVTKQIYIAAASQAKIWIQDQIRHDILPVTRQEKLKGLKTDKKFQRIIASLLNPVSDGHLIRMLGEAEPGLWKLGKSTNKKYRKKRLYSS